MQKWILRLALAALATSAAAQDLDSDGVDQEDEGLLEGPYQPGLDGTYGPGLNQPYDPGVEEVPELSLGVDAESLFLDLDLDEDGVIEEIEWEAYGAPGELEDWDLYGEALGLDYIEFRRVLPRLLQYKFSPLAGD